MALNTPVTRTQVPDGARDRLPAEAAAMRRLSARLDGVFRAWGYREVSPPVIEYLEAVSVGAASWGRREDLYQLFDRKGRTLALRPDMTTPIARLVATRLADEPLPLRLSYFSPVFRHRELRAGATSEIWQAGVEPVGVPGEVADAEVISLACAAVKAAELEGFRIGLGHVGIVEGLLRAPVCPPTQPLGSRRPWSPGIWWPSSTGSPRPASRASGLNCCWGSSTSTAASPRPRRGSAASAAGWPKPWSTWAGCWRCWRPWVWPNR